MLSSGQLFANIERVDDNVCWSGDKMIQQKTMQDMQTEVDQYIRQFKEGYFSPLAMVARLVEELGELSREVNHVYGEKPKKATEAENTIENELGDLLFVTICLANSLGIDLQRTHDQVMHKFATRDKDRWTKVEDEKEKL